jgi:hypothetical protein
MRSGIPGQAFDRPYFRDPDRRHRRHTRTDGLAIEMDGTRTTLRDTAPVLGAGEFKNVTNDPQQGRIGLDIDLAHGIVHFEADHADSPGNIQQTIGLYPS